MIQRSNVFVPFGNSINKSTYKKIAFNQIDVLSMQQNE